MAYLFPDDDIDIFLLDCPRQTQWDLPYKFLEQVKSGKIVSQKYECTQKTFKPPHVFCFMNIVPKFGKTILSADRYLVVEVGLTPEEQAGLSETQTGKDIHPYVKEHLPRTEEIREEAERIKAEKRSHVQIDGHTYHDNVSSLMGGRRKKTASQPRLQTRDFVYKNHPSTKLKNVH